MEEKNNKIGELQESLEALRQKQGLLAEEIARLSKEIGQLKTASGTKEGPVSKASPPKTPAKTFQKNELFAPEEVPAKAEVLKETPKATIPKRSITRLSSLNKLNRDLEDFIGASLISKIGIIAIVVGVGIGLEICL